MGRDGAAIAIGLVAGLLVVLVAIVPIPYYTIAPGHAVDLESRITVEGRAASRSRFYLTDVLVTHATLLLSLTRFLPGTELVPSGTLMPPGQSGDAFDRTMTDAMTESQNVSSYVAERAAGLPVSSDFIVTVAGVPPGSHARGLLRRGDRIVRVGGRPVSGSLAIARALAASPLKGRLAVLLVRSGRESTVNVRPMRGVDGKERLGVYVSVRLPAAALPVPVRFSMGDVSGASGGLLFTLAIYADITGRRFPEGVSGTGTIAPDGTVGPIEGTRQKLEAARRVHATIFFVPLQNAHDLAGVAHDGIAVVPVATFAQALHVLEAHRDG